MGSFGKLLQCGQMFRLLDFELPSRSFDIVKGMLLLPVLRKGLRDSLLMFG